MRNRPRLRWAEFGEGIGLMLLFVFLIFSSSVQAAVDFKDLTTKDECLPYVNYLAQKNIITGFPDASFRPAGTVTRAQMAQMLVNANGATLEHKNAIRFSDVKSDYWAYNAVTSAAQSGFIQGFPDGTFRPEAPASRAEVAAMLLQLTSAAMPSISLPDSVTDSSKHWASSQIAVVLDAHIMRLDAPGKFAPDKAASRSEVARGLALMLTLGPEQNRVDLTGTLVPVKGQVQITRADGSTTTISSNSSCSQGDTIITGANSEAELNFPDGSGFKINENTRLIIKEALGCAAILPDGSPGTRVDMLQIGLPEGQIFGALANSYLNSNLENNDKKQNTPIACAPISNKSILVASLDMPSVLAVAGQKTDMPWYQTSTTKKVRIKVDMPWGVAAVRGTFWMNEVRNGRETTNVAIGELDFTSGGQTVTLPPGQFTGTTGPNTPPTPPTSMPPQQLQQWNQVSQWIQQTAQNIEGRLPLSSPLQSQIGQVPGVLAGQIINGINGNISAGSSISSSSGSGGSGPSAPAPSQVGTPTANPGAGTYSASQSVSLSTATPGATIYYTIDNSDPKTSSSRLIYTAPIPIAATTTVKAYATKSGMSDSGTVSLVYTIMIPEPEQVAAPTGSPVPGEYSTPQGVSLSTTTPDATIYYTTDNSDPKTSSSRLIYTAPITVTATITVKAYAVKNSMSDSAAVTLVYTITIPESGQVAAPVGTPASGIFDTSQNISLSTTTSGATIYYTTDYSDPTNSETRLAYSTPLSITESTTIKAYAVKTGMHDSEMVELNYGIVAITVINNASGDDRVNVSELANNIEVKIYDAASGGTPIATGTACEGLGGADITGGFNPALDQIYVSITPPAGVESNRLVKAIPKPPTMNEYNDYDVDTVDCGYGKIAFTVTNTQKEAMETACGKTISTIKAYLTSNTETTFATLAEAEATGGVVVPAGDTGVAIAKDPGLYGYAVAAYDNTDQVVAYYVSNSWKYVESGLSRSPSSTNLNTSLDQTFTITAYASAGTFKDIDLSNYVSLEGAFASLAKGAVTRLSPTQVTVQVTGNLNQTGYGKICIAADAFENATGDEVRQVAEVQVMAP